MNPEKLKSIIDVIKGMLIASKILWRVAWVLIGILATIISIFILLSAYADGVSPSRYVIEGMYEWAEKYVKPAPHGKIVVCDFKTDGQGTLCEQENLEDFIYKASIGLFRIYIIIMLCVFSVLSFAGKSLRKLFIPEECRFK